jgi:hypothetical protein
MRLISNYRWSGRALDRVRVALRCRGLSWNTVFITKQYVGAPVEGVVYRCPGRG